MVLGRLLCLLALSARTGIVDGFWCRSDLECQELFFRPDMRCLSNGKCENPFIEGCLKTIGKHQDKKIIRDKRLCNSDDKEDSQSCIKSDFDFPEFRIHHGAWETTIF